MLLVSILMVVISKLFIKYKRDW